MELPCWRIIAKAYFWNREEVNWVPKLPVLFFNFHLWLLSLFLTSNVMWNVRVESDTKLISRKFYYNLVNYSMSMEKSKISPKMHITVVSVNYFTCSCYEPKWNEICLLLLKVRKVAMIENRWLMWQERYTRCPKSDLGTCSDKNIK